MVDLTGRVALVTGAGQGLGRAMALAFARAGASVGVLDLEKDKANEVCNEIRQSSGEAISLPIDISNREQVFGAVDQVASRFGNVDILVNNACFVRYGPITAHSEVMVGRMLSVGLEGVIWGIQAVVPHMESSGRGVIISMSSGAAKLAIPNSNIYSLIKGGVAALSRAMAAELGPKGIRVNSISPGPTPTTPSTGHIDEDGWKLRARRTLLPRMGKPMDVAALAVFLASDDAGFITGDDICVDGGFGISVT